MPIIQLLPAIYLSIVALSNVKVNCDSNNICAFNNAGLNNANAFSKTLPPGPSLLLGLRNASNCLNQVSSSTIASNNIYTGFVLMPEPTFGGYTTYSVSFQTDNSNPAIQQLENILPLVNYQCIDNSILMIK